MPLDDFSDASKAPLPSDQNNESSGFIGFLDDHKFEIAGVVAALGAGAITRGHWMPSVDFAASKGAAFMDSLRGTQLLSGETAKSEILAISKMPLSPLYEEPALSIHNELVTFKELAGKGKKSEAIDAVERALDGIRRESYWLPTVIRRDAYEVKYQLLKDFAGSDISTSSGSTVSNLVNRLDEFNKSPYSEYVYVSEVTTAKMQPGTRGWVSPRALHNGKFFDIAKTRLNGLWELEERRADSIQVARRANGSYIVDTSSLRPPDDQIFDELSTIDYSHPDRLFGRISLPVSRLMK